MSTVVLENVTLVRFTEKSIQVILSNEETCYVPLSQLAEGEVEKCRKLLKAGDVEGVNLDVSKWWAETAGMDYTDL